MTFNQLEKDSQSCRRKGGYVKGQMDRLNKSEKALRQDIKQKEDKEAVHLQEVNESQHH